MSEPTGETYEIENLEDMMKIPDGRIDAFLKDLRIFLEIGSKVVNLLAAVDQFRSNSQAPSSEETGNKKADAMRKFGWTGNLIWSDDGKHDQTLRFEGPDGEELAELVVDQDGVEPAEQESERAQE